MPNSFKILKWSNSSHFPRSTLKFYEQRCFLNVCSNLQLFNTHTSTLLRCVTAKQRGLVSVTFPQSLFCVHPPLILFSLCCTGKRTKICVFVLAAVRWWMVFAADGLFLAAFLICQHVHIDRSTPPSHEWAFDVKEQTICGSLGRESQSDLFPPLLGIPVCSDALLRSEV